MKKLTTLLVFLGIIGGGLYLSSGYLLEGLTQKVFEHVVKYAKEQGFDLGTPTFSSIQLSSYDAATWNDMAAQVQMNRKGTFEQEMIFSLEIDKLNIQIKPDAILLNIEGLRSAPLGNAFGGSRASKLTGSKMEIGTLSTRIPVNFSNYREIFQQITEGMKGLLKILDTGKTSAMVLFEGKGTFMMEDKPADIRISMHEKGDEFVLALNRDDLKAMSERLSKPIYDPEIDIIAEYPIRAPRLLQIRDKARRVSSQAHQGDPSVPEDAYRHVTWSYLLTKEYDAEFAKVVTDAHETGATDNTEADHRMDYNNNGVGRRYAAEGERESNILNRLKYDSTVITAPV